MTNKKDCWYGLITAIIQQAVDDYIKAYKENTSIHKQLADPNIGVYRRETLRMQRAVNISTMESIERFFLSEWYEGLCNVDGKRMIALTRQKAKEKNSKQIVIRAGI